MRYRAFGATRFTSGVTPTSYRYTGQREEAGLGLYYYGARWYDPALGHFTQPDTIVPDGSNVLDFNRYSYVRYNSLKYTDPTGHCADIADVTQEVLECVAPHGGGGSPVSLSGGRGGGGGRAGSGGGRISTVPIRAQGRMVSGTSSSTLSVQQTSSTSNAPTNQVSTTNAPVAQISASTTTQNTLTSPITGIQPVGSGQAYSVLYQTKLPTGAYPGRSRAYHNQLANESLLKQLESDPEFAKQIEGVIPNIRGQLRSPSGTISRSSPTGWTWHHAQEEGVMQLVPKSQHTAPGPLQDLFHPTGRGGYSIWGVRAEQE